MKDMFRRARYDLSGGKMVTVPSLVPVDNLVEMV
jgi:hypothetical protein